MRIVKQNRNRRKNKDYVLSPSQFGKSTFRLKFYRYTMAAHELIKEGDIEHFTYTPGDVAGRIIGGIVYGVLLYAAMVLFELRMNNNQ